MAVFFLEDVTELIFGTLSLSLSLEREPSTWGEGDEGQGRPFMGLHLRERRQRFWGNAVEMRTALGAEAWGKSRPEERS